MQILQVSSEMTPIAKVGGLGDVLMGLTRELGSRGHEVLAVMPFYGCIDVSKLKCEGHEDSFETFCDGKRQKAKVAYYRLQNGTRLALLDMERRYFRRHEFIYGGDFEVARFLIFSRAVAEWLIATKRCPDIVHVHDWPSALVPLFYRLLARGRPVPPSVFTIHNFDYQGRCAWDDFRKAGFSFEDFPDPSLLQDSLHDCLNLVKAGLLSCERVTTVSPTYAREVVSKEGGTGLDKVLSGLGERFVGILNGIDDAFWNPATDPYLSEQYSSDEPRVEKVRAAKLRNKEKVFSSLGVPMLHGCPLLVSVTRLVKQKGIYMIRDLFARAEELHFQGLVLGSVPEPEAAQPFKELDTLLRSKGRGAVLLTSDELLAHQMYAASDMFVAPSLFEPCGLTQLIALKYGSIPIVRKTGGLADTVFDVNLYKEVSNGFQFETPSSESFLAAAARALTYFEDSERWGALMTKGMTQDFSWHRPGGLYEDLYRALCILKL